MTRVAFVLSSFAGGGAQRVLLTLATNLQSAAFTPVIVVFDDRGPWRKLVPPGTQVVCLNRTRMRSAWVPLLRALRAENYDVIVSTMAYVNFGLLLMKPFLGDSRVIVREANIPKENSRSALGGLLYWIGYRFLYHRADRVLCPARTIATALSRDCGVDAEKIEVLRNPVDEDALRSAAQSPRRVEGEGLRFVAAGRLTRQKGYDLLLNDFAVLPDNARLTIFGDGNLLSELQQLAQSLGLTGRVNFAGFDPRPAPWIAGADALLLPSRWEGLPNVALEALACGTPVIATPSAGGIREIAELTPKRAVTIAANGQNFVEAMKEVVTHCDGALRPSLLPRAYCLQSVIAEFTAAIAA